MWLSCSGERWVTTTNAMPESDGSAPKKAWSALSDPAEPAIPTIVGPVGVGLAAAAALAALDLETALDFALFLVAGGAVFFVAMGQLHTFFVPRGGKRLSPRYTHNTTKHRGGTTSALAPLVPRICGTELGMTRYPFRHL